MKVLVAYATRHGATKGIAERVGQTLEKSGLDVTVLPATKAKDVAQYDAFVVGGAAYAFHWLKDASNFVRRNQTVLASHPTWLFSSGPLGDKIDPKTGKDARESTVPREFAEFDIDIRPRGERVFFGAWDPKVRPIGV
ncbi:MAG TPA: flavodoxin domain-containing protein, partial [Candidatus Limnocylindrales bacterium]